MTRRIIPPLSSDARDNARVLRQRSTEAESELWFHLRAGRLNGWKFRRQHPMPPIVCDFYREAARLVVELDGSQHTEVGDARRTELLGQQGVRVLRFWNDEVLKNKEAVLEVILSAVENRTLTPTPLPRGEGPKTGDA